MSNALTTIAPNGVQTVADRGKRDQLLRNLILPKATPEQLELVLAICQRYGFDPLLRHVLIVSGNLYVTRDGLRHMAWQSGEFDGYDPPEERQDDKGKWIVTAKVWRKGIARPFVATAYQVEAENTQSSVWRSHPRLMTGKVAEVIALRMAFGVSLGGAEEIGFEDGTRRTNIGEARFVEAVAVPPQAPASLPANATATGMPEAEFAAWSEELAELADAGTALRELVERVNARWDDLSDQQSGAVTTWLAQVKAARKAGHAAPENQTKPRHTRPAAMKDEALLAVVVNVGGGEEARATAARTFLARASDAEGLFARVAQLTVLDFPRAILDVLVAEQRERLGLPDDEEAGEPIEATVVEAAPVSTRPTWVGDDAMDDVPF